MPKQRHIGVVASVDLLHPCGPSLQNPFTLFQMYSLPCLLTLLSLPLLDILCASFILLSSRILEKSHKPEMDPNMDMMSSYLKIKKLEDDDESAEEDEDDDGDNDDDDGLERERTSEDSQLKKKRLSASAGEGVSSVPASGGGTVVPPPCCLVESCQAHLTGCKKYYQRHRVCEVHAKAPAVSVDGLSQRFCQQCSRFHEISEFDQTKRSCRSRLAGHNERRRKSSLESQKNGTLQRHLNTKITEIGSRRSEDFEILYKSL